MKRFKVRMELIRIYECEFEEEDESDLDLTIRLNGVPDDAIEIDMDFDYEIVETEYIENHSEDEEDT